eukprot:10123083-Heterocapsa_arctica.AAC.1
MVAAFRTSVQASSPKRDDIASLVHRDARVALEAEYLELGHHLVDEVSRCVTPCPWCFQCQLSD